MERTTLELRQRGAKWYLTDFTGHYPYVCRPTAAEAVAWGEAHGYRVNVSAERAYWLGLDR